MRTNINRNQSGITRCQWLRCAALLLLAACPPLSAQQITIAGGSRVSVGAGSVISTTGGITIADTGSGISNCGTIQLKGRWINNGDGAMDSCPGIVELKGELSPDIIAGNSVTHFSNLIINNPQGVTLNKSISVSMSLQLTNGKLIAKDNDILLTKTCQYPVTGGRWDRYIVTQGSGKVVLRFNGACRASTAPIGGENYAPVTLQADTPSVFPTDIGLSTGIGRGPTGDSSPPGENLDQSKMCSQYWRRVIIGTSQELNYTAAFDLRNTVNTGNMAAYIVRRYNKATGWTTVTSTLKDSVITTGVMSALNDPGYDQDIFLIGEAAGPLGVGQPVDLAELHAEAYPNPSSGRLTVRFGSPTPGAYHIRLADVTGRTVLQENGMAFGGMNTRQIDMGMLANGVYVLVLDRQNTARQQLTVTLAR